MSYLEIGYKKVECIHGCAMFKDSNEFVPCFWSKRIELLNRDSMFGEAQK